MQYTIADQMVVCLARELRDGDTAFHGVASPIPAAAILLAQKAHGRAVTYVNIAGGVNASPRLAPSTDGPNMLDGTASLFGLTDIFDLSMRGGLSVAFLSGVQIDRRGRINSSVIGEFDRPKVRLPGGAGSAVIAPTCGRVLVWRGKHNTKALVEEVDFVSATGNIDVVVTPLCVFRRVDGELQLESIHATSSLAEVQENTGFPIPTREYPVTPPPTAEEMAWLERIDPDRARDQEL